ncbi:MAG: hypothetical protein QM811_11030 [Pirellulales bacterium]
MPRILIYEECVAAGVAGPLGAHLSDELLAEGWTMLAALAADFAALEDCRVRVPRARSTRLPDHGRVAWEWVNVAEDVDDMLRREAAAADWTLVIAPECDGLLTARAEAVLAAGGRLLGPNPAWIALTGDKHRLCETLRVRGVFTPPGIARSTAQLVTLELPSELAFPIIIKPVDGAGSVETRRIADRATWHAHLADLVVRCPADAVWRIEKYQSGRAVSAAFLCGSNGRLRCRRPSSGSSSRRTARCRITAERSRCRPTSHAAPKRWPAARWTPCPPHAATWGWI